jgi:hypothetical protein
MCDYSLKSVRSRPAKVGDVLATTDFGAGTRGFASITDPNTAICVLPGTELAFAEPVRHLTDFFTAYVVTEHKTAIFRQINQHRPMVHHDALEFPDGTVVLLTRLAKDQHATVLQLPAREIVRSEIMPGTTKTGVGRREGVYAGDGGTAG